MKTKYFMGCTLSKLRSLFHMALIEIAQKATSIMHCVLVSITERPSAGHDAAVVAAWLVLLHEELFPLLPRQISVVVESAARVR